MLIFELFEVDTWIHRPIMTHIYNSKAKYLIEAEHDQKGALSEFKE